MQSMIDFITQGSSEFTPQVVVGIIVFCLTLECIGSVAYALMKVGRR